MQVQTRRVLWRFLMFSFLGLVIEVCFTGLGRLAHGNWNLTGHSSPWMMIDYGMLGIVTMPIARPLMRLRVPLVGRAVAYMLGIYAVEFVSGWIFNMVGIEIWDYSKHPYNLFGYITLSYAPFWYTLGLGVEFLYRRIDACAVALSLRLRADDLLALKAPAKES